MSPPFKRDRPEDNAKGSGKTGPERAVARKQKLLTCPLCGGHDLYNENALITGFK